MPLWAAADGAVRMPLRTAAVISQALRRTAHPHERHWEKGHRTTQLLIVVYIVSEVWAPLAFFSCLWRISSSHFEAMRMYSRYSPERKWNNNTSTVETRVQTGNNWNWNNTPKTPPPPPPLSLFDVNSPKQETRVTELSVYSFTHCHTVQKSLEKGMFEGAMATKLWCIQKAAKQRGQWQQNSDVIYIYNKKQPNKLALEGVGGGGGVGGG